MVATCRGCLVVAATSSAFAGSGVIRTEFVAGSNQENILTPSLSQGLYITVKFETAWIIARAVVASPSTAAYQVVKTDY